METSGRIWKTVVAAVVAVAIASGAATVRVVLIGDSTMCTYAASKYPWKGWGQELEHYFKTGSVTVLNYALGGRSSRSFVTTGRWATAAAAMQSGDWLFIQFGHNDRDYTDTSRYTDTATYKEYLAMYIDSARAVGVHPVLVTPMNMNTWTDTATRTVREVFTEGANNYWGAMKHVGAAKNVPVLDLGAKSTLLMDTMGCGYMRRPSRSRWRRGRRSATGPTRPRGTA
jgi:lysophospholipase L1-like esterase